MNLLVKKKTPKKSITKNHLTTPLPASKKRQEKASLKLQWRKSKTLLFGCVCCQSSVFCIGCGLNGFFFYGQKGMSLFGRMEN